MPVKHCSLVCKRVVPKLEPQEESKMFGNFCWDQIGSGEAEAANIDWILLV